MSNWSDESKVKTSKAALSKVATLVVFFAKNPVHLGERVQAVAEALDANGVSLTDLDVTWSTSGFTEMASVDAEGLVTAKGLGNAEVTAQCEGKVGKLALTITG
jgi:Bacterial Ig-like domain (group 2).